MDIPAGFSVSQVGGVTYVRCDTCEATAAEPHQPQVVLAEWAAVHWCEMSESADDVRSDQ